MYARHMNRIPRLTVWGFLHHVKPKLIPPVLLLFTLWIGNSSVTAANLQAAGVPRTRDFTSFQTASPYSPSVDIGSDVAMVYGVNDSFAERLAGWRAQGYTVAMMTGIAWGSYDDYYQTPDGFRKDEVQTTKTGRLYMHGNSTTVGYNVPSDSYVEYIKRVVELAVDLGVQAVYLEEPEYWAETGWSEGFKKEWGKYYGEAWQAPDSSVDAQYRASRLKYELYFNALRDVFRHIKARAAEKGFRIECHVPTHSLINYAQWRIVSPESHLMDLDEMDGYIAQVWTGTARSHNLYRGVAKERTFETAFLEYGQMLGMVRPTGRKVWFLADPVEDNPDHTWSDYKLNYECTVIASLMWPEVHRFEVMPWPQRIFQGHYRRTEDESGKSGKAGIPSEYATQILTVINALNDMDQTDVRYDTGSRGIGVIVSDTLMFQRASPHPSEPMLSSFFGLAMPLVKHGVPVEIVQLENTLHPNTLAPYKVLLLTYEGMKPLKREYHAALAKWVRDGGGLIYIGDGTDLYDNVREWWNNRGATEAKPQDDLFAQLGIGRTAYNEPEAVGKGFVRVFAEKPRQLARYGYGAQKVIELVAEMTARQGTPLRTQNYIQIRRGPYVVASVLEESVSDAPLTIDGHFIDLFDPALPALTQRVLAPGERTLLYELDWLRGQSVAAKVVAAAARVRDEQVADGMLRFTTRGPEKTTARVRILLPRPPRKVEVNPPLTCQEEWDADSSTLRLTFDNLAQDTRFAVAF